MDCVAPPDFPAGSFFKKIVIITNDQELLYLDAVLGEQEK
jgi:hypothetical protein